MGDEDDLMITIEKIRAELPSGRQVAISLRSAVIITFVWFLLDWAKGDTTDYLLLFVGVFSGAISYPDRKQ